jgi:hypothetical protein
MGIYNNIHDPNNDDNYYYCPVNDCPCHQHYFYDSSGNHNDNDSTNDNNIKYEYNDEHDVYFNYVNHDYYNNKYKCSSDNN